MDNKKTVIAAATGITATVVAGVGISQGIKSNVVSEKDLEQVASFDPSSRNEIQNSTPQKETNKTKLQKLGFSLLNLSVEKEGQEGYLDWENMLVKRFSIEKDNDEEIVKKINEFRPYCLSNLNSDFVSSTSLKEVAKKCAKSYTFADEAKNLKWELMDTREHGNNDEIIWKNRWEETIKNQKEDIEFSNEEITTWEDVAYSCSKADKDIFSMENNYKEKEWETFKKICVKSEATTNTKFVNISW